LLNEDTESTADEFIDFTPRGEGNLTGPERPLRTVYEPSFETPTEDAANALTTNLSQSPLNGCYVINQTHAHSIGAESITLHYRQALPTKRTKSILLDLRQDIFTRLAPGHVLALPLAL
jgi:hypothetical protein